MDIRLGMTSITNSEGTDFDISEDGTITSTAVKEETKAILIKVDGTKAYEYEVTKDLVILYRTGSHADLF